MTYTPQDFSDFSMLDIFRMEVESQVTTLNDNLLAVESQMQSGVGGLAPQLESLMRSAHSIKGAARIIGLDLAVKVAHVMEDCFVAAQTGKIHLDGPSIDTLLKGIDWYDQLRQVEEPDLANWIEQQTDETTQLVNEIGAILHPPVISTEPEPSVVNAVAPVVNPVAPADGSSPVHGLPSSSQNNRTTNEDGDEPSKSSAQEPLERESLATLAHHESSEKLLVNDNGIHPSNTNSKPEVVLNTSSSAKVELAVNGFAETVEKSAEQPAEEAGDRIHHEASLETNNSVVPQPMVESEPGPMPPTPTKHPTPQNRDRGADRVVRVSVDNLNRLMALAGESLVEVNWFQPFADTMLHLKRQQQELARSLANLLDESELPPGHQYRLADAQKTAQDCYALLSDRLDDLDQFSRRFSQLSDNLYQEVIASHMSPFVDGVQGFPRMVRDLAKQLGKQVHLDIVGQRTPVDRDILEKLEAPLTHILRNAIAHGIEEPAQRQKLGKSATGTIRLEAIHRAGMLCITVSDDGRGIDPEILRQQVVAKQLTTAEMADQMNSAELMDFLFLPGFSTAKQVTEIAGRGVGLDIAHTMVQEVGGLIRASSVPGQGLTFHFQLPLTLSVIRALLVEISGEPYAFGLNRIDRVLMVNQTDIAISENHPYIIVDDEAISLAKASQVMELPDSTPEEPGPLPVVLISNQTHRYGLIVDQFLGEQDLVIRPLDPRLKKVQDISAAALTDKGLPLLVVDVADLVCSIEQRFSGGTLSLMTGPVTVTSPAKPKRILVVDDSITVREMERKLLQNSGYQVDVAVNGMEGWNTVRSGDYDLVISDIDMPRMNGIELVQQIKRDPHLNPVPVIIVSYKDRQDDQLAGLRAGADYYLTKSSFHDNSLLTAVADLIGH